MPPNDNDGIVTAEEVRQVVEAIGGVGMLRSERFFADRQRALIERLGFGVIARQVVKLCQKKI